MIVALLLAGALSEAQRPLGGKEFAVLSAGVGRLEGARERRASTGLERMR